MSKKKRGRNWCRPNMNNTSTGIIKNSKENLVGGGIHYGGVSLHDAPCQKVEVHRDAEAGIHYGETSLHDDLCKKMKFEQSKTKPVEEEAKEKSWPSLLKPRLRIWSGWIESIRT